MLQSAGADDSFPARYVIGDDQRQEKYDENKHGVVQAVALHFNQGWYVGLGVGATMLDPEGQSGGFSTNDDSDSGAKLMIGQQFLSPLELGIRLPGCRGSGTRQHQSGDRRRKYQL